MKALSKPFLGMGLILIASFSAHSAMALSFKGDGARIWVERTNRFIEASQDDGTHGRAFFERGKAACDGISGELFKIGGVIPIWAAESHRSFCRGIDGFYGQRNIRKSCGDMKSAIGYLGNTKSEKDPEEVVAASAKFRQSLEAFMSEAKKQDVC